MKIKVLGERTGLSKSEIIFLRKENLLRQQEEYNEEAVVILQRIKLMRKLGINVRDIMKMQKGILSLNECMSRQIDRWEKGSRQDKTKWIEIARSIKKDEVAYNGLDAQIYLKHIDQLEQSGYRFKSIKGNLWSRLSGYIPPDSGRWFEPDEPILSKQDFTKELIKYAEREKLDLMILREGIEPIVEIEGERYMCLLESPRMLKFPWSIFFATSNSFGFKFVYLYKHI